MSEWSANRSVGPHAFRINHLGDPGRAHARAGEIRSAVLRDGFTDLLERLGGVFAAWASRRRVARTVEELSRLEPHILRDIGVPRNGIVELAESVERRRRTAATHPSTRAVECLAPGLACRAGPG